MTACQSLLVSILFEHYGHRIPRFSGHSFDTCIQMNADILVYKQGPKRLAYIRVFFGHQPSVAINHSHFAAESAHRLGKLYSDVATADDEQMFGNLIQFERLDMREGLCFSKTRNCFQ